MPVKKYSLTSRHKAQLKPWADKWIANALSAMPMDHTDREAMRTAISGLYDAAKLPLPVNVVFAAGPVSASIAAGISAGVWYLREHKKLFGALTREQESTAIRAAVHHFFSGASNFNVRAATDAATYAATSAAINAATSAATRAATRAATYAATSAAISAATRAATDAATDAATYDATSDATYAATDAATRAATRAATYAATDAATYDATSDATYAATDAVTNAATYAATDAITWRSLVVEFLIACACRGQNLRNGGNQWSGWVAFLSFFRHVAKLKIDYSRWDHYEQAAIHAGPRFMGKKFCIVSDRPKVLRTDEQGRPHCATGPSHVWSDGVALYYWHGIKVERGWIENPNSIDPRLALTHKNLEQRSALAQILGWEKILAQVSPRIIDKDPDETVGELLEVDLPDSPKARFLRVVGPGANGARGVYILGVPREVRSALEANCWTQGETLETYSLIKRV